MVSVQAPAPGAGACQADQPALISVPARLVQISYGANEDASFFEYDNEAAADSMGSFVHRWAAGAAGRRGLAGWVGKAGCCWPSCQMPLALMPFWFFARADAAGVPHPRSMAELEYNGAWARLNVDLVRGAVARPARLPAAAAS
jgi:hypothetical protein